MRITPPAHQRTVEHDGRVTTPVVVRRRRLLGDGDCSVTSLRVADDGGYTLAMSALMIVPLMVFLAFAVDLGAWYGQASKTQRAADAAAMAGVVWLPNTTKANTEAANAAKANGITSGLNYTCLICGPNQYQVTISSPAPRFFSQVFGTGAFNITRTAIAQYNKPIPMGTPTNKMGNDVDPANCPQWQPQTAAPCGPQPFMWAAINGPYDIHANGDPYSTRCPYGGSTYGSTCDDSSSNPDYRSTGYDFAVDVDQADVGMPLTIVGYDLGGYPRKFGRGATTAPVTRVVTMSTTNGSANVTAALGTFTAADVGQPVYGNNISTSLTTITAVGGGGSTATLSRNATATGSTKVQVGYDCNSNKAPFNQSPFSSFTSPNWNFVASFGTGNCQTGDDRDAQNMDVQLYDNDGSDLTISMITPLVSCHLGVITATTFDANPDVYKNKWVPICTFTPTQQGIYPLRVRNSGFGSPADTGTGTNAYALKVTGGSIGTQLYSLNDMSIFTNSPGSTAKFYLAEIKPEHAGKKLVIDLYDPGDGGGSGTYTLTIKGPAAGAPATTPTSGTTIPAAGMVTSCNYNATPSTTKGPATPNSAANCSVVTHNSSGNPYNERWLRFEIQLATSYTCGSGAIPDCWWTVQYDFSGGSAFPTDRTVWSLNVVGDPVHLVK